MPKTNRTITVAHEDVRNNLGERFCYNGRVKYSKSNENYGFWTLNLLLFN